MTDPAHSAGVAALKSEERLLRGLFGDQHDLYAKRVLAFLPLPRPR